MNVACKKACGSSLSCGWLCVYIPDRVLCSMAGISCKVPRATLLPG